MLYLTKFEVNMFILVFIILLILIFLKVKKLYIRTIYNLKNLYQNYWKNLQKNVIKIKIMKKINELIYINFFYMLLYIINIKSIDFYLKLLIYYIII